MSISKLFLASDQPEIEFNDTLTEFSEIWLIKSDELSRPSLIMPFIKALGANNEFGFPKIGSQHESDPSVLAIKYNLGKIISENHTGFTITVSYSNQINAINNSVAALDAEPDYAFDKVIKSVQVTVDTQDPTIAIENTNGTQIIVFEDRPYLRFTLVRNESDFNPKKARKFMGTINNGSVKLAGKTFPDQSCKLDLWAGSARYDSDGELYWSVRYEVLIDEEEGFERKFINRGVVDKNGKSADASVKGLISGTEYKLKEDGTFYNKADQLDPTKFFEVGPFNTLPKEAWGVATRLGASPSNSINELSGNLGFGL